jgi:hypothetical protein
MTLYKIHIHAHRILQVLSKANVIWLHAELFNCNVGYYMRLLFEWGASATDTRLWSPTSGIKYVTGIVCPYCCSFSRAMYIVDSGIFGDK